MASKSFYHDIDLNKVGQLKNARVHNLSTSEIDTLSASLSVAERGLVIYNTTSKSLMTWNGAAFDSYSYEVTGDIKFAGLINAGNSAAVTPVSGSQYVVDAAGTLSTQLGTISYSPSANVEVGDVVLFTSATTAVVIQRNLEQATDSTLGTVRLATQGEVDAGTDGIEVVTAATLHGYVNPITSGLQGQITSNDGDIATLQSRATAVEGRATDLETFTGEGTALTTAASTLAGGVNELVASVATNASAIAAEAVTRGAADTTLQNNIDTEATARAAGDTTLQGNIDTEAATRAADDATLQGNIDIEAAARVAADIALQGGIDSEATARAAADTALDGRATSLEGRATALEARDEVFTYFASIDLSANTPATVAHGLALSDKDAFTINTMYGGAQVSLSIVSVNADSLTVESAVGLTGVKVTVIGF